MAEPTRYDIETKQTVETEHGAWIRYSDYFALRKLAEAVVRHWNSGAPIIGTKDLDNALRELEEYLR